MKKFIFACLSFLVVLPFFTTNTHAASTQNFSITNYNIAYSLSKDETGRSILKTVETITAGFPKYGSSNHGIERAIPKKYDGHPTHIKINAVTDENGAALHYSTYSSNGNEVIRIGDEDTLVRGDHTYVITYTQTDVTKYFADTKSDEFYWDTNGVDWKVPIDSLSVHLTVDKAIAANLNGASACYQGVAGSTNTCTVKQNGTQFDAYGTNLKQGENMTLAIGFQPHTFNEYVSTKGDIFQRIFFIALTVTGVIAIALWIFIGTRWYRWQHRRKELKPIAPEYLPPKDASVTIAGNILGKTTGTTTAQLLDFAVRHYIRIYETETTGWFKQKDYILEIIRDTSELRDEERELLTDMFGEYSVGTKLAMSNLKRNTTVSRNIMDNPAKIKKLVRGDYGLRAKHPMQSKWFTKWGIGLLIASILFLSPPLFIVSMITFIYGLTLWPLTDHGLAVSRYLEGLKLYITVAETERIRMLQSPDGAAKTAVRTDDNLQLVHLYERVLPYAVLFGVELQWVKQLGQYYESLGQQPDWFTGNAPFNAVLFAGAVSGFATTTNYSAAGNASTGGSTGGGSSGGGGGGGGGGGW